MSDEQQAALQAGPVQPIPYKGTTFNLRYPDGKEYVVDENQLWAMLQGQGQLLDVTVSCKEGRQRVKYEGVEKFISGRRNYERSWALVNSITDHALVPYGRRLCNLAIQKDILETEAWFQQMMGAMFAKDSLQPYWRSPENPFVKAGWDIQAVFQTTGLKLEGAQGT